MLLMVGSGEARDRRCRQIRDGQRLVDSCTGYAQFEAFPASGAGTSGPCSPTAPTGARGEVLTFARASSATCTKTATGGLATTGIASGDLSIAPSGDPRVEYDGAGTLGLLVESARTNSCLRSQEFENAYWTNDVVPTANAAVAPDGTTTAERYQFTATTAVQRSIGFVSGGCPAAGAAVGTLYVKGVSGSGTMDICTSDLTTSCTACAFVSTSWTRCSDARTQSAPGYLVLGNASLYNGGVARSASDVYVWGAQCEAGAYATSYIPTVAAMVTRAAEAASFTLANAIGPSGCLAASETWGSSAVGAVNFVSLQTGADNWTLYRTNNTTAGYQVVATVSAPTVAAMGVTTHRSVFRDATGTRTAWWDASSVTAPAVSVGGGMSTLYVGAGPAAGTPSNGITSRAQVDPAATRCDP